VQSECIATAAPLSGNGRILQVTQSVHAASAWRCDGGSRRRDKSIYTCAAGHRFNGVQSVVSKRFANHFFTPAPERLSTCSVKRIASNAFADGRNDNIVGNGFAYMAVLAVSTSDVAG
jgi:hypothetical protein